MTIEAAEQLKRRAYGIEIEPRYCDVAVKRWMSLTGEEAILEATQKTFTQTAADRGHEVE